MVSYLDNKRRQRSFLSYNVKCDLENNPPEEQRAGRFHVWWAVVPIYAIEEIHFRTIVTREGSSTSEV